MMKKILRIDLEKRRYDLDPVPGKYLNLGGRGLTSSIISQEVPPNCDPMGPANKLVIAAGILAGTNTPNSGRLSIGAKSPLTKTIKESNAGGSAAHKLGRLGIQAIILEGQAEELVTVKINKDGVSIMPEGNLCMRSISYSTDYLRKAHGDNAGFILIGPAGEMGLGAAVVAVTTPDFFPRIAARGGLGSVMGAKNVKAIIVDDTDCRPPAIKNEALFKASVKAFTNGITSHPLIGGLQAFGTPILVGMVNEMGAIPTKNFSEGMFGGAPKISGEAIADLLNKRPNAKCIHHCMPGCIIGCSNVVTDEKGEVLVSGLEYETLALMGSNCTIDDVDIIARMNGICNDVGLDTMEVGGAIAVAMEAGMLPWGNGPMALGMVEEIVQGTETGRMIGNGCKHIGEKLGIRRIPHVKGQCLGGYDPRVLKGTGVTYATSPMGADHTCGNALPSPTNPGYDPSAATGQAPVSQFLQHYFAAIDTLGLCLFAALPTLDMPELQKHLIDCVAAVLDESLDDQYLLRLGKMVIKEERKFNMAAGFDKERDRLPSFFKDETLAPGGGTFDVSDEEIDSVYQ